MALIAQSYFDFFKDLSMNNNRDWFLDNKKRYEREAKEPFIHLLEQVIASLTDTEPELGLVPVKNMLFRINRDTRFSKDKQPYKEHLGASITRFGTKDKIHPGHYLQLGSGENFIAGGAYWFEEKEMLYRVRQYIAMHPDQFAELIDNENFKSKWSVIKGDKNKRVPPDFEDDVKRQPLILNTQFYWSANVPNEAYLSDNIVEILRGYWLAAQPLNNFLKEAMYNN